MKLLAAFVLVSAVAVTAVADPKTSHTGSMKSARLEVRWRPNSWAAASVERTLAVAEADLDRIGKALDCKPKGPFTLYLYDDLAELAAITGTQGTAGFSAGTESHIPYANDQTRLHEMVHLVAATFPKTGDEPRNLFFAEGLANAVLEYVDGVHVHAVAAFYLKQAKLPALAEMTGGDFYDWLRKHQPFNAYDVGGSWMRFLLDRFGAEKVKRYYAGTPAKTVFGADADALEKSWREMLAKFVVRPETETVLRRRAGEAVGFEPYVKGLPADLVGKPSDWTPLLGEKLGLSDLAKWNKEDGVVTGTNPAVDWTTCEFGATTYDDCAVRAKIRTSAYCALRVQIGPLNQAMLVGPGTFLFRGDQGIAQSPAAMMTGSRRETDFVVVRRGAELEVWIDGAKVLVGPAVPGQAVIGVGVAQGSAQFVDVKVRKLDAK